MRVATIDILIQTIAQLYPVTFTPNQIPAFTEQYRSVLSGLSPDELNDAWHKCMETWRKKAGPSAADILASHRAGRTPTASNSNGILSTAEFLAKQNKRDADRTEERRELIEKYERNHAPGYAMARAEGWIGQLETQVKRSANIIAQRNEQRRAGAQVQDWRPELSEDRRTESFVPWVSIVTHEGVDMIEIGQDVPRVWRAQAAIPGPATKPIKQTTLQNIGFQSVETSSAA